MNTIQILTLSILFGIGLSQNIHAAEYKVAVRAIRGIDAAHRQWQATVDVLNKSLPEHHFTLIPVLSLDALTSRSGRGEFDFVLTNPSSFVEIQVLHGATALVTLNNKRAETAQSYFGSVIFTHVRNEDILTIQDLKNKKLMAVSEPAFGGWRVAWMEMLEQGFNPYQDLKELLFAKSKTQPEVVWAVRDDLVHAGVVRTDLLEHLEVAGKIDMRYYRILNNKDIKDFPFFLSTKLYPEWPFVAMKHIPLKDAVQVTKVLMNITPESQAAQSGNYIGWITPDDYSSVVKLLKRLEVGPFAK